MPAEPALLHEAACWVDTWQEPNGHTNYEAALQLAERYLEADCCYIFSAGLSDYAGVLLEVCVSARGAFATLLRHAVLGSGCSFLACVCSNTALQHLLYGTTSLLHVVTFRI